MFPYPVIMNDKTGEKNLYFVNIGSYQKDKLNELHEFALFVADSPTDAKKKAKESLLENVSNKHKDNLMEVDECLQVNTASGKFIHLQKSEETFDLQPDWCGYNVIG